MEQVLEQPTKRTTLVANEKELVYALLRKHAKYNKCQITDIALAALASKSIGKDIKPTAITYIRTKLKLKPAYKRTRQSETEGITKNQYSVSNKKLLAIATDIRDILRAIATRFRITTK